MREWEILKEKNIGKTYRMESNFAKWEVCSQYDGLILKNIECDKNISEVVTFEKVLNSDFLEIADWDTVEVNTVVKVRMNWGDTRWRIRHFAKYKDGYETRCVLKAKIDVADGLNIIVSHFGLNKDEQKNAVTTVLENLPDEKCVLMGDFNMKPKNRILKPIKEKLFDTAEMFECKKLSYPSDKPRVKIDYIFVSKDLCVSSADIPEIISSDHRPYISTVEI